MALSERTKKGLLWGGGALGLLALAGVASANDGGEDGGEDDKPDDQIEDPPPPPRDETCPRGFHRDAPGGPCVPDDLPPPPTRKVKDYVGSGYNWPRRDLFPTEQSFVDALDYLGYQVDPTWKVLSGNFMQKVGYFQSDWNLVRKHLNKQVAPLVVDDLIGKNTINALAMVEKWEDETDLDWGHLVNEARA